MPVSQNAHGIGAPPATMDRRQPFALTDAVVGTGMTEDIIGRAGVAVDPKPGGASTQRAMNQGPDPFERWHSRSSKEIARKQ